MASTAEIAEEFGTDGKTLRKFFRSSACEVEPVGQGSRYELDDDELKGLKKQFNAWAKGKAKKAANPVDKKKTTPRKKKTVEPEILEDEDAELDDVEPDEEELEEIEDLNLDDDEEPDEEPDFTDEELDEAEDENESEEEPASKKPAKRLPHTGGPARGRAKKKT